MIPAHFSFIKSLHDNNCFMSVGLFLQSGIQQQGVEIMIDVQVVGIHMKKAI